MEPNTADRDKWLHIYRQMFRIRVFEEHVNQLYTGAKMPGLAHLYIGEEAAAVGVCEALRRDDYITAPVKCMGAMMFPCRSRRSWKT